MTPDRRDWLKAAGLSAAALAVPGTHAAEASPAPLKFELGIVTYNIAAKWDLPTLLKALQASGVKAVEFRTSHPHGVEPTLSTDERREVKKRCADAGIRIWGLGSVCEFHSPDQSVVAKQVEDCKRFSQLAADLGARGVKVRPNALPGGVPKEKTLEQIGRSLIPCGEAAAAVGTEVWVEVHGKETQLPANMQTMMQACGHAAVGVCWNSNPTDVVNGSVRAAFDLLKPWIKSCHINELYKDSLKQYPYRELFSLLRGIGYDRVTLCEVAKSPGSDADGIELLRYYRALWLELAKG